MEIDQSEDTSRTMANLPLKIIDSLATNHLTTQASHKAPNTPREENTCTLGQTAKEALLALKACALTYASVARHGFQWEVEEETNKNGTDDDKEKYKDDEEEENPYDYNLDLEVGAHMSHEDLKT